MIEVGTRLHQVDIVVTAIIVLINSVHHCWVLLLCICDWQLNTIR